MMKARFRSLAGPVHEPPPYQQKQQVESIARRVGGEFGIDASLVQIVEDGLGRRGEDFDLMLRPRCLSAYAIKGLE
jgi:hypothetical protein